MNKTIHGLCAALLFTAACGQTTEPSDVDGFDAESIELAGSTAGLEGDEVAFYNIRGGRLAELRGPVAFDLFGVMSAAGGFSEFTRGGADYVLGRSIACVANSSEALCQIASGDLQEDVEGFRFVTHGSRFSSASGELFGALARASGVEAARVTRVNSERFVCGKDTRNAWCGMIDGEEPAERIVELVSRFVGLEDLGPDYVYEGWLITADGPVSAGRFDILKDDETLSFEIDEAIARASTNYVLTIEPAVNDVPAPADTHILAGDLSGNIAQLSVGHGAALGDDFGASSGTYILGVPSEPSAPYSQGIWFVDPNTGRSSLNLPELPAGWAYEGWVVTANGPISTGRFTDLMAADSDGAGPDAGPIAGPPFPGQDFVNPALDLVGTTVVISVEPEPDNSAAPFTLKPLIDMVDDAGDHGAQGLRNMAADTNPRGVMAFFDEAGNLLQ